MKRGLLTIAASATLLAGPAEAGCPPARDPSLTLGEYLNAYDTCSRLPASALAAPVEEAISARPSSTGGSGFASELRDTIEDFLPLFKIGLDSLTTSDDGTALNVRFNPIRTGRLGAIGLTATVTEPEVGGELLESIPEASRGAVRELVDHEIDDFSNLTLTARWGYERTANGSDLPRQMWGRNVDRYRPILEQWMAATAAVELSPTFVATVDVSNCDTSIDPDDGPPEANDFTLGAIRTILGSDRYERCLEAYEHDRLAINALDRRLEAFALLPALIDNQPQLVFSVARHERDPLVGRSGWSGKVTYERGFHNFNRLLRLYHRKLPADTNADEEAKRQAQSLAFWEAVDGLDVDKVKSENKLTISASYEEGEALAFNRSFGEGDDAVTAVVDLPRRSEVTVEGEYLRNATWHPMEVDGTIVFPRFHVSFEYVDVSDDPQRQDRGLVTLTYDLPLTSTISVPLSLTYADHAEFLGEHDEQFGAHLGFSYKLPWDDD